MSFRSVVGLAVASGFSLIILPQIASAATLSSRPEPTSALVLAQAQPDPMGAHATVDWAKERLSEIDAAITILEEQASNLHDDARKRADDALEKLRTTREAYRAEIEGALADGRQKTEAQISETRAVLDARWNEFEHDLGGYLDTINSDVALRKAVFEARMNAEGQYWRRAIAELKTSATNVATEQRAAIEARIAELQGDAEAAKARLGKLEQAGGETWSALRDGLTDASQLFDKTNDAVRTAIERAKQ